VRACDYIFVALYPEGIIDFRKSSVIFVQARHGRYRLLRRQEGLSPASCSESAADADFTFIGGHPMAGTERSGFRRGVRTAFFPARVLS
jgi:prephenate dehydrogenase